MRARDNPFAPTAGRPPPAFLGRDAIERAMDIDLDRVLAGRHANSKIILGFRGVGKTVLLNKLHTAAKSKGYETIRFEVQDRSGRNLAPALVPFLAVILRRLDHLRKAGHLLEQAAVALQAFAARFKVTHDGVTFGVAKPDPVPMLGDLERDLPVLLSAVLGAAAERGTALAVFIDEVQYLSTTELSALARACHEASQQAHPLLVVATGLPQLAALTGQAKSYSERLFEFPQLGALDRAASAEALRRPARELGVDYTDAALARIYADTEGYPYFLQTWGSFTWDAAKASPIDADVVDFARPAIDAHLDRNFFRVRFDQCKPREQRYLRGMAELGPGPHATGAIAEVLSTRSQAVAPARKKLIDLGLLHAPSYGETGFTVPLFDRFMKRVMPELEPYSTKAS